MPNSMTNSPQAASDEKTLKAALEAGSIEAYTSGGIRRDFSFHEAQLRRFAAILSDAKDAEITQLGITIATAAEEIAKRDNQLSAANKALKAEREVRGMLVKTLLHPDNILRAPFTREVLASAKALDKKEG